MEVLDRWVWGIVLGKVEILDEIHEVEDVREMKYYNKWINRITTLFQNLSNLWTDIIYVT